MLQYWHIQFMTANVTIQLNHLVTAVHNWTVRQVNHSYNNPQHGTKQLAIGDDNLAVADSETAVVEIDG